MADNHVDCGCGYHDSAYHWVRNKAGVWQIRASCINCGKHQRWVKQTTTSMHIAWETTPADQPRPTPEEIAAQHEAWAKRRKPFWR